LGIRLPPPVRPFLPQAPLLWFLESSPPSPGPPGPPPGGFFDRMPAAPGRGLIRRVLFAKWPNPPNANGGTSSGGPRAPRIDGKIGGFFFFDETEHELGQRKGEFAFARLGGRRPGPGKPPTTQRTSNKGAFAPPAPKFFPRQTSLQAPPPQN